MTKAVKGRGVKDSQENSVSELSIRRSREKDHAGVHWHGNCALAAVYCSRLHLRSLAHIQPVLDLPSVQL